MSLGIRVLRGPDWDQNEANGGEGHLGTVVGVKTEEGTVEVVWDNGQVTTCRAGKEGKHDLRILDNAQAGVKFPGASCNHCMKPVLGMRWSCVMCSNVDLCSLCYVMDVHDLSHEFDRYVKSGTQRVRVGSRQSSVNKVRLVGIFPGARVTRGRDWLAANADGGAGGVGTVVEVVSPESGSARNAVRVSWDSGESLQHRLGLHGKVDLVLSKESPSAPFVWIDHLPVLELEKVIRGFDDVKIGLGDIVKVEIEEEKFKVIQKGRGGWSAGLAKCIGLTGAVKSITPQGDVEIDIDSKKWRIHPLALKKVAGPKTAVGDKVRILDNLERVMAMQVGHRGWNSQMRQCLGKVGKVKHIHHNGDYRVSFGTVQWSFNPLCCLPDPHGEMEHPDVETSDEGVSLNLEDLLALRGMSGIGGLGGLLGTGGVLGLGGMLGTGARVRVVSKKHQPDDLPQPAARFLKAVQDGDLRRVVAILDENPAMIRQDVRGGNALHVAANAGESGVASVLLDRGAVINQRDREGETPLIMAVSMNKGDVVELLLKRGADLHAADENGHTALHMAAIRGRTDLCRLLMGRGANINHRDNRGSTTLFAAMKIADEAETLQVLLEAPGADVHAKNMKDFNLLHYAAFHGRPRCAAKILARERSLVSEVTGGQLWTPLHVAAVNDHAEVLHQLVQAGGEVNGANLERLTPLHMGCKNCHIDIVMILAEAGADLNAQDENKFTPLHFALDMDASHRNEDSRLQVANYLVQQGARTDLRNNVGQTPLDAASDSLRARVEAFIRDNHLPTTRPSPAFTDINSTTTAQDSGIGSKVNNQTVVSRSHQTVMAASTCSACAVREVSVIFLPCAHKLLCQSCANSVSVCPRCQKQVKRKIDSHGKTISS